MPHVKTIQRPHVRLPPPRPVDSGLDWGASGWAGLAAGAAFILLQMMIAAGFGGEGRADPVRLLASIALGESVVKGEAPASIVFLAAAAVHLQLSMIYARVLAGMIHRRTRSRALVIGGLFGLGLYFLNYYAFAALFPWFTTARGPAAIIAHVGFGVIAAWIYKRLTLRAERRF